MLGFIFGIQNLAQFIDVEIGYLVVAFPAQVNSRRAFVRVFVNAHNRCFNYSFHAYKNRHLFDAVYAVRIFERYFPGDILMTRLKTLPNELSDS
jgi:hypothetical protein